MSGRTEQPTPRRLREARRRGDVAVSRELTGLAALLAGGAALVATAPAAAAGFAAALRATLGRPVAEDLAARQELAAATRLLTGALAPVLLAAAAGALGAGLLQTRALFATRAASFRAERLSPARNLRQLASVAQLSSVALALARVGVAAAIAWSVLPAAVRALASLPRLSAGAVAEAGPRLLAPLAGRLALALAAFAALDLWLVRRRHARALRMTCEEVRREQREDEGDPRHREERRRRHRAVLEAAPVSRATCVVVNPTHLAIALLHDRASDAAPLVVAKGAGAEAARIRAEARRAAVPVVRDVALARALWRLAELGEEIPEELYDAAAAILVHVHGLAPEAAP